MLKFELSELDAAKSQEFLNYFIAQLKEKGKSPFLGNGTAKFNSSGQFETLIDDFVETNSGAGTAVTWKITQNADGSIPFIEVSSSSSIDINECTNHINTFYINVQKLAFSEKKEEYFNRNYFCFIHGSNLDGEYWLNNKLRVAPLYPEDDSTLVNAERIIVVDQLVAAIDQIHSRQLADERSSSLSAQLSLLFDIGFYKPVREKRYAFQRSADGKSFENIRFHLGVWDKNELDEMPRKKEICSLSQPVHSVFRNERFVGEDLSFPKETRILRKIIEQTDFNNKAAFEKCCGLYQVALNAGRYHPTIMLSYMVGAIDSIKQTTGDENSFSEFVRKYDPSSDSELLDDIYSKIRSAHWHGGKFAMGDNESGWKESLTNQDSMFQFHLIRNGRKSMRTAILNWVANCKKP